MVNDSFRSKARKSWRPVILVSVLLALAGTSFIVVKAMFADKLERFKGEMKALQVLSINRSVEYPLHCVFVLQGQLQNCKEEISKMKINLQKTKEHKDLIKLSLSLEKKLRAEESDKSQRIRRELEQLQLSKEVQQSTSPFSRQPSLVNQMTLYF